MFCVILCYEDQRLLLNSIMAPVYGAEPTRRKEYDLLWDGEQGSFEGGRLKKMQKEGADEWD